MLAWSESPQGVMIRPGPGNHQRHHVGVERRPSGAHAPQVLANCSYSVTPSTNDLTGAAQPRFGVANAVFVYFLNTSHSAGNAEFYLTVTC